MGKITKFIYTTNIQTNLTKDIVLPLIYSLSKAVDKELLVADESIKETLMNIKQVINTALNTDLDRVTLNHYYSDIIMKINRSELNHLTDGDSNKVEFDAIDVDLSLVFKRCDSALPSFYQDCLELPESEFRAKYDDIDDKYFEYVQLSTFRDMHGYFKSDSFSLGERYSLVLGTFLSDLPEDSVHLARYCQTLGLICADYLKACTKSLTMEVSAGVIAKWACVGLGFAMGVKLHKNLTQNANSIFSEHEDNETILNLLHDVKLSLLNEDTARYCALNPTTSYVIESLLGVELSNILKDSVVTSTLRNVDYVLLHLVGNELLGLDYEKIIGEFETFNNEELISNAINHTLIACLQAQFPND